MNIQYYTSVASSLAECGEALCLTPAKHSLILGLLFGFKENSRPHFLFSVKEEGALQVCGLQIDRGRPLILAFVTDEPSFDFVNELHSQDSNVLSVVGTEPTITHFADVWCTIKDTLVAHRVDQTLFELTKLNSQGFVDQGTVRPASEKDRELIKEWITAFQHEAMPNEPYTAQDAADFADSVLGASSLYLLCVSNEAVAMAAIARPTPLGASINAVYTPPQRRKKGFASTLVAELCHKVLHDPKKHCWLYADKKNPTANHIYVNIGFRRVCDSAHITFAASQAD